MKYLVLLGWLLLGVAAGYAQEAPVKYDHRSIAILPLRVIASNYNMQTDSSYRILREQELAAGVRLQEALYNSMHDDKDLLVEIQPWQTTDSLLKLARIDMRQVNQADKRALAALLKVDAVLGGALRAMSRGNAGQLFDIGLAHGAAGLFSNNMEEKILRLSFYDGKTGDEIWNFEEKRRQMLSDGDTRIENRLFRAFRKSFPYTR